VTDDDERACGVLRTWGECAYWKEEPSLRQVLHMVDADDIYVVPNFISEGLLHAHGHPSGIELTGPVTQRDGRTIKYCEPVGNHQRMTELLMHRAAEVAPGVEPGNTSLLSSAMGRT